MSLRWIFAIILGFVSLFAQAHNQILDQLQDETVNYVLTHNCTSASSELKSIIDQAQQISNQHSRSVQTKFICDPQVAKEMLFVVGSTVVVNTAVSYQGFSFQEILFLLLHEFAHAKQDDANNWSKSVSALTDPSMNYSAVLNVLKGKKVQELSQAQEFAADKQAYAWLSSSLGPKKAKEVVSKLFGRYLSQPTGSLGWHPSFKARLNAMLST